jgi:holo-[acyl-carrier protein] synthase
MKMPRTADGGRLRIGVDVISVHEVARTMARFGERYARRVFTVCECAYCEAAKHDVSASRFATRFAAKEAALKVLRPRRPWTDWRSIEVRRHSSGWCELVLHGEAAALAARQGITSLALSMSRADGCAVAVVVGRTSAAAGDQER